MMLTDFGFYIENYGGELIPNDKVFDRLNVKASSFINKITFNRIDKDNVQDEIKFAICSMVDEIYNNDRIGNKTTETVGNHTISYAKLNEKDMNAKLYNIAKTFLPEELLYRGVY